MNRLIRTDLYRHGGLHGSKGFIKAWHYPGFRYTYFFRKVSQTKKNYILGLIYRLLLRRYRFKYGFEINPEAQIDEGFYLTSHLGPIIIGPVKIGRNCNIGHSVTIGRIRAGKKIGSPVLGDYVWVGTGAVIVGGIHIGSNVLIAPNAFVNFDVPDHSLVLGNPGRIIRKDNPTNDYINYAYKE